MLATVVQQNGKRFFKRPVSITVAAEYSSIHGHGALWWVAAQTQQTTCWGLTKEGLQGIKMNKLSSTLRELRAEQSVVNGDGCWAILPWATCFGKAT
jgi:hypothetical protein